MNLDRHLKLLESIQTQIRAYDTKAQVTLALASLLGGFFGQQTLSIAEMLAGGIGVWPSLIALGLYFVSIVSLACTFYWGISTIRPQLEVDESGSRKDASQPTSRLFYAHIAHLYQNDYKTIVSDFSNWQDDSIKADAAEQILANAHVCVNKTNKTRLATNWLWVAFLSWMLLLILLFLNTALGHTPTPNP